MFCCVRGINWKRILISFLKAGSDFPLPRRRDIPKSMHLALLYKLETNSKHCALFTYHRGIKFSVEEETQCQRFRGKTFSRGFAFRLTIQARARFRAPHPFRLSSQHQVSPREYSMSALQNEFAGTRTSLNSCKKTNSHSTSVSPEGHRIHPKSLNHNVHCSKMTF